MRLGMAWRITGIYGAVGIGWILASSAAVWLGVGEAPGLASFLEMGKGLAFIVVTSALLLALLRRWEGELDRRGKALEHSLDELAEVNARLTAILKGSQDLVAAWDMEKRVTAFNPRYRAVCWDFFQRDVRLGMSITELFGGVPDRLQAFSACWDRTLAGESFVQLQSLKTDGDIAWFETAYAPLTGPGGKVVGGCHIVRDVTLRVRAEEERKLHADKLTRAVESLTEANSELERFAYVASHDLQEPLRTVTCFSQMIARDYTACLDDKGREYLALVTSSALRMHQMINDLLAYCATSRADGRIAMVSAQSSCDAALATLRDAIEGSDASIITGALPQVAADPLLLIQVFQQLLSNAIKYHKVDQPPLVEITASRRGEFWEFAVHDNGIGFDPRGQDVFELFRRLHPNMGYAGTGVGLSICKRIITRLGGRIWAESETGKGSTFRFTLPAGGAPSSAVPPA